jgi:branched-chain amino acid transport system ATP-binding protein
MLEVENLSAGYDGLQVLWDVSLRVRPGEFVALLGPNGAGKSTALRVIAGLLRPTAGSVKFAGNSLAGLRPAEISRAGIRLITEDSNLFLAMSVYENLLLGAYTLRHRKRIDERMEMAFALFPVLKERRKQLAGTLSGGERKMLGLARALMARPKLFLVDEPSLGLAPRIMMSVFEALQSMNRQGMTLVLVEQNVNASLSIANRAYLLERGRIVLEGESGVLRNNTQIQESYLGLS